MGLQPTEEVNVTDRGDWAEYDRDMQELRKAAIDAAVAAKGRCLTEDEIMALAYSAGIAEDVYLEIRK